MRSVMCLLLFVATATAVNGGSESDIGGIVPKMECHPISIDFEQEARAAFLEAPERVEQSDSSEEILVQLSELAGVLDANWSNGVVTVRIDNAASLADITYVAQIAESATNTISEVAVERSCISQTDLDAVSRVLGEFDLPGETVATFGYSPYSDRILVQTNIEVETVNAWIVDSGVNPDLFVLDYLDGKSARLGRTNDGSPHSGGARISRDSIGCSSGFSLENGSGSTTYSMTAAHCGSGTWVSGPYTFSTITWIPSYPTIDLARLAGSAYTNMTYSADNDYTAREVVAAGNPANGYIYCNYGASSRRSCFTQVYSGQTYCDEAGCTKYLSVGYNSGSVIGAPGDSGGPIVKESGEDAKARGSVVAGTEYGTYLWYHVTSTIQGNLGVWVQTD